MAKLLKPKKHKVAPQKVVEEDRKIVLVGTYRSGQLEKWPGFYNYPIGDGDKIELEFARKVNEIWLFNAEKEPICLKAEFIGFKTRDELKAEYGYPATGKPRQLDRIEKHGVYNYPVKEEDELNPESCAKVKVLWLYASAEGKRYCFEAESVGIQGKKEFLEANPTYKNFGQRKHTRHMVFKTTVLDYGPQSDNGIEYGLEAV